MIIYETLDILRMQKETLETVLESAKKSLKEIHPLMIYQKGKLEGIVECYEIQLDATDQLMKHIEKSLCKDTVTH